MDSAKRRAERNRDRRHRALLAFARKLDGELGPDQSAPVYRFPDGWSVKEVTRLEDQRREGYLMANCLKRVAQPMRNLYSLRDPDDIPHVSFSGWRRMRRGYESELEHTPRISVSGSFTKPLLIGTRAVLFAEVRGSSFDIPERYRERLYEFEASPASKLLAPLPATLQGLRLEVIRCTMGDDDQVMVEAVARNLARLAAYG